jgi:hypothetical protein
MAELIRTVDGLFARFPLDEENKARRARAVDQRARVLAQLRMRRATAMAMRQHGA